MSSFHIAQLEALFYDGGRPSVPEFRMALERLHSELLARERRSLPESKDFFLRSLNVLKRFRGQSHIEHRLECLQVCLRYFFYHGDPRFCLEAASEHQALAAAFGSPVALRLSNSLLGMVHADIGNIGEALHFYADAIELSRQLSDTHAECMVLNNLGTAFNYAGLYQEAIRCFERILQHSRLPLTDSLEKSALSNLAQSHYYLENFEPALDAIKRCTDPPPDSSGADANFRQTIREFVFVQIALEMGLVKTAIDRSSLCTRYAIASGSERSMTMARLAAGLCSVRTGNVRVGLSLLEQTLADSRRLDSSYRDALVAIVKAYDEAGDADTALEYIEKLLSHARAQKAAAVQTLVSISGSLTKVTGTTTVEDRLQTLERRRAILRARVAEREAFDSKLEMLERLAVTADLREDQSGAHGYRVGRLSALVALALGRTSAEAKSLELAARLHDIGKIAIPDRILGSSQALKEGERRIMCMHCEIGAELLAQSKVPQLKLAEEIAKYHHEWWDGSGYPKGLKGTQIPLNARIVALADVFDALTHGRAFAQRWETAKALDEIRCGRGRQFDPKLSDCFLAVITRLATEHSDLDSYLSRSGGESSVLRAHRKIKQLLDDCVSIPRSSQTAQTTH